MVDRDAGRAEYGSGGGIVWDSAADDEYREAWLKARVLTEQRPEFSLLETMLWTPEEGFGGLVHLLYRRPLLHQEEGLAGVLLKHAVADEAIALRRARSDLAFLDEITPVLTEPASGTGYPQQLQ